MSSFDECTDSPISKIGIALLDDQHYELHCLIKELAVFPSESILSLRTQRVLREVWRCSFDHFRDEERLMVDRGVMPVSFGRHVADHARCLNYIARLWSAQHRDFKTAPDSGDMCSGLAEYWQRHIAEYDMAIASLDEGMPAHHGFW